MKFRCAHILVAVVAAVVLTSPAHARRRSLPKYEWNLDVRAGMKYDDNLLRLSDSDQDAFRSSPAGFPVPIETVDDGEADLTLAPSVKWRAPHNLMVTGDYRMKWVHRFSNSFTDYQTHSVGASLRPRVSGYRWSARLRAFTIPSFYLRTYRDRDNFNEYHSARFANWDYQGSFRYRLSRPLWLDVSAAWGSYYYNAKFTEYDSEYWDWTLGGSCEFPGGVSTNLAYTRRQSDNIGSDRGTSLINTPINPDEIGDSEYGDADFNEDEFNAGVSWDIPALAGYDPDASLSYRHRRRVYTTNRSFDLDPFHRGRLDNRYIVALTLDFNPTQRLRVDTYVSYEQRETESPSPSVRRVKDFVEREIGIAFNYSIR